MTFNEAKLRTRLGMKVKLKHWTDVKCVVNFHDDKTVSYELMKGGIRRRNTPANWTQRNDWEIYHEV